MTHHANGSQGPQESWAQETASAGAVFHLCNQSMTS